MRSSHETSYQTIPRNNSRSRSQNHYYIQANEFERRYQNSLYNAYRLNSSRKCPPCCYANGDEYQKEDERGNQYYEGTQNYGYEDSEGLENVQRSKRYLEELLQKGNLNFRIHKEKTQTHILTLERLLQQKTQQIQQLSRQISRLKKMSMQSGPGNVSYLKQDNQPSLVQIQTKQQQIKQLERKISRLREENSFYREDIEIKNKEIQQQKQKFRLKQENDLKMRKELQQEVEELKAAGRVMIEKINWMERQEGEKQSESQKQRERNKKLQAQIHRLQTQLQVTKRRISQIRFQADQTVSRNLQKFKGFENQFRILRERCAQKDKQIQNLISKINCIQSELDFFKEKFTNLLFQIQREERQSATIFQQAVSLKQHGQKFYEEKIRRSQIMELESHSRGSRLYGQQVGDPIDNRLTQSLAYNKVGLGKEQVFHSLSPRGGNRFDGKKFDVNMVESGMDFMNRFPSLNMSISPIRTKQ